ncbi:ATP-grasp domain-containing protein [Pseudoduganella violaceinigra]|uniref:ATP-grasp domain-containing protein n=1 Tax=Pseudoduganella violaceinigra TaxID=246602 RepID=UPI0003FA99A6|nr:ATP-grasp domain-containing protein [Pseudoduganella violaceinigra]
MKHKVKWLVQKEGFAMANRIETIALLERLGFAFGNFGILPSSSAILNLAANLQDPEERYIIRGGTRLHAILSAAEDPAVLGEDLTSAQLAQAAQYIKQLRLGVFYDEKKFDQAHYSGLGLPLLNADAKMYPIESNLAQVFDRDMFIKPSKDEKAFDAGILAAGQTIEGFIASQPQARNWREEMAVIAPCKTIIAEYRFFVVNREVVTGSLYRFAGNANFSAHIPGNVMAAATEFAPLYQPHAVFTMDLAETPDGIRIVEYNCWNASRMYAADVATIFHTVHEFISQEN